MTRRLMARRGGMPVTGDGSRAERLRRVWDVSPREVALALERLASFDDDRIIL